MNYLFLISLLNFIFYTLIINEINNYKSPIRNLKIILNAKILTISLYTYITKCISNK